VTVTSTDRGNLTSNGTVPFCIYRVSIAQLYADTCYRQTSIHQKVVLKNEITSIKKGKKIQPRLSGPPTARHLIKVSLQYSKIVPAGFFVLFFLQLSYITKKLWLTHRGLDDFPIEPSLRSISWIRFLGS